MSAEPDGLGAELAAVRERLDALLASAPDPPPRRADAPTVAAYLPRALALITNPRSAKAYAVTFRRLAELEPCLEPDAAGRPADPARCGALGCDHRPGGDLPLPAYTPERLVTMATAVKRRAVAAKREEIRRRRHRRALAAGEPADAAAAAAAAVGDDDLPLGCGVYALEGFITGARKFFALAVTDGHVEVNPAEALRPLRPRRPATRRRALLDDELDAVWQVALAHTPDPAGYTLLLWLHYETGARVSDGLRLRLYDADPARQTLRLGKKGGVARDQPVSASLLAALLAHAAERGAVCDDEPLLRIIDADGGCAPLEERHYHLLWRRVRRLCPWAQRIGAATHGVRKAAGRRVERLAGERVAEAFLGHFRTTDAATPYLAAGPGEVALAVEALTGERHPLADHAAPWLPIDYTRPPA